MVNQLRTLLLNINGSLDPGPNYPGEAFVQPTFNAIVLPGPLQTIHRILFGVAPDRAFLNYRLRELLSILHTTPLAEYVYALDPRVTYWPPRNNSLFDSIVIGSVVTPVGATTADLTVTGGGSDVVTTGNQILFSYLVTVASSSHVTITQQAPTAGAPVSLSYQTTAGWAAPPVQLPNSNLGITFKPTVGAQWQINWLARPTQTLAEVFTALQSSLTDDLVEALFGADPAEPYLTFANLWALNPYLPYRVGGVTLALAYRINALLA